MTDSAHMITVDDESDSLYLHADTLRSRKDSSGENRIFNAYYGVRIYKSNLQGKCDSLSFTQQDSIIRMYYDPVVWSDSTQITANFIEIHTTNNNISQFFLEEAAFMTSMEDSTRFNQIKGRNMTGYFRDNKLYKVEVNGNGQTIYYTRDKNKTVGVNKAVSSNLLIKFINNEVRRITFIKDPEGTLYPLGDLEETRLSGFQWLLDLRPKTKYDIFLKIHSLKSQEKKEQESPPPSGD